MRRERDDRNLAVGPGAIGSEAGIRRNHLVEQCSPLFPSGYTSICGEALALGFDGNMGVGGDVKVPRWMVVLAVVGSDDDKVVGFFKLEVHEGRRPSLAALAPLGHKNKGSLALQSTQKTAAGEAEQEPVHRDKKPSDDKALVSRHGELVYKTSIIPALLQKAVKFEMIGRRIIGL